MADEDLTKLRIARGKTPPRPRHRRLLLWGLPLSLLLLLLLLWRTGVFAPAAEVEIGAVSRVYPSRGLTRLNASGYVVAQRRAAVASEVTGRLVWLGVEEGSRVQKGQVIARLESRQAEASREQAKADLATARARVGEAEAEAHEAGLDRQRLQKLLADRFISQAEYDRAEARYRRAEATLSASRTAVSAAEAALQRAEVALDYTRLRAPFDAVVLTKNADIGDIVTPIGAAAEAKAAVVTIADLDSLQVEADVSESNLGAVTLGQPCEIELDALPEARFPGEVHMIVPTADRSKATVLVKVRFLERDPRVLPEMSARVAFLERPLAAAEREARTAVPQSALAERNGRTVVFRVTDGRAEAVPVRTGLPIGEMIEVAGIEPGQKIVLSPPAVLDDGDQVKATGSK